MFKLALCVRCYGRLSAEPSPWDPICEQCAAEEIAMEESAAEMAERGLTLREQCIGRTPLAPVCRDCGEPKEPGDEYWVCYPCEEGRGARGLLPRPPGPGAARCAAPAARPAG